MYQPQLRDDLIPRLYRLRKAFGVPMTSVANAALEYGIAVLEQALAKMGYTPPDEPQPQRSRTQQPQP